LAVFSQQRADADNVERTVIQATWLSIPRSSPGLAKPNEPPWLRVDVSFGHDSLNAPMLLWAPWLALSALLITEHFEASFYALFCAWEGCLLGCFAAYDAFTFLACDAAALGLASALIGGCGGANRRAAAGKLWRHQFAGHAAWWAGLVATGVVTAWCRHDFLPALPAIDWSWLTLSEQLPRTIVLTWGAAQFWQSAAIVLFVLLTFGALVRTPVAPFHSWWAHTISESPMSVAVLLSAVWCPLGMYAWLRFVAPAFTDLVRAEQGLLTLLAEVTVVWGGLLALSSADDLRRFAASATIGLQGIAWLAALTGSTAGHESAWALSQATGIGGAAWILTSGTRSSRNPSPTLWFFVCIAFAGFPALARCRTDWLIGRVLTDYYPMGLLVAIAGMLLIGWGAISIAQCLVNENSTTGDNAPKSHQLSWTEILAFAPILAWGLWYVCQPLPVALDRLP